MHQQEQQAGAPDAHQRLQRGAEQQFFRDAGRKRYPEWIPATEVEPRVAGRRALHRFGIGLAQRGQGRHAAGSQAQGDACQALLPPWQACLQQARQRHLPEQEDGNGDSRQHGATR
ncbi:hypothetical protein [Massilia eburnea]|uniref:hypothetical protein n=1 Tax=Massilia eburnea TaxID=1776165 RepID=UPI003D6C2ABE